MSLLRRFGVDLLIVIAALESALEVALAEGPDRPTSWYAAPSTAILILTLLGRRRWRFAAPVTLWLLAAALSFADGRLIVYPTAVMVAGIVAAFLLGNLPDARQRWIGLAVAVGWRGDRRLQQP